MTFGAKDGRYVRLKALSSLNGQPFTPIGNLQVRGTRGATTTTIDDRVTGVGPNQFNYQGAWQSCTNCGADLYAGTNSWDNVANDAVTVAFTGTQIRLYGVRDPRHGIGMVSIDGGPETAVDFYNSTRQGNFLLWTSPDPGGRFAQLPVARDRDLKPERHQHLGGSRPRGHRGLTPAGSLGSPSIHCRLVDAPVGWWGFCRGGGLESYM